MNRTIRHKWMIWPLLATTFGASAQAKQKTTATVKIYGNCEMCEHTIEQAAFKKGIATADWNKDTKMAVITYDSKKQSLDEILKRIAYSGYDNEKFLAPDEAYRQLPACCQYTRPFKKNETTSTPVMAKDAVDNAHDNPFHQLFTRYFEMKDALVRSDAPTAAVKAKEWEEQWDQTDMKKMDHGQHRAWMEHEKEMKELVAAIAATSDIDQQRKNFSRLSEHMVPLAKLAKLDMKVYLQHCPMYEGGADWLSTEAAVKNPYYGSQMLTCGKTVETIGP